MTIPPPCTRRSTADKPGSWYAGVCAMIKMLTSRGLPARELLVASDVGEFLMADPWILNGKHST